MKKSLLLLGFILTLLCLNVFAAPASKQFIGISDIHFNPLASCSSNVTCPILAELQAANVKQWQRILQQQGLASFSQYGQDSNYYLLASVLKQARMTSQHAKQKPNFILLAGDNLGHHLQQDYMLYAPDASQQDYQHFIKKVYAFLTLQLKQSFPNTPIYPVIGNNDSYNGDYYSNPNGPFYKMLTRHKQWGQFILNHHNQRYFQREFPAAGYYQVMPRGEPKHRVIIVNSILFSALAKPSVVDLSVAAETELSWLSQTLAADKRAGNKVWLVFHIPYGMDAYGSQRAQTTIPFWSTTAPLDYNQQFLTLLDQYKTIVTAVITAHTHNDAFRLYDNIVDSFIPSVSAIHGNNPAFKVYRYHAAGKKNDFQLMNSITYYLPLQDSVPQWQLEYRFDQAYSSVGCKKNGTACLQKIMATVATSHDLTSAGLTYQKYYAAQGMPAITEANWPYFRCAINDQDPVLYQQCIRE